MKRYLAASALMALALTACDSSGTAGTGTIKIGFIAPLTGDAAALGNDMLSGARWAVDELNAAGGIDGKQVELVAEDGKCTGVDAASAAQKLVNVDKVAAVVGGLCSGETLAAAPIVEAAKVVLISPGSSNPTITDAGEYIFRNYPSDALKTVAMAKYFAEKDYAKVAVLSENTDFAQGFRGALKENLPEGAVVFDEVVEPGTKDFRTLMTRLKDVDFDVILLNPNSDSVVALMVQQLREAGLTQEAISHDVAESAVVAEVAGDTAEGFRLINVPSTVEGTFAQDFESKYGKPQGSVVWAAYAFDAVNILAEGWKAGAADGTALSQWMVNMAPYKGIVATISFDENGDVEGIPYQLKEFRGGSIVKIQDIAL